MKLIVSASMVALLLAAGAASAKIPQSEEKEYVNDCMAKATKKLAVDLHVCQCAFSVIQEFIDEALYDKYKKIKFKKPKLTPAETTKVNQINREAVAQCITTQQALPL